MTKFIRLIRCFIQVACRWAALQSQCRVAFRVSSRAVLHSQQPGSFAEPAAGRIFRQLLDCFASQLPGGFVGQLAGDFARHQPGGFESQQPGDIAGQRLCRDSRQAASQSQQPGGFAEPAAGQFHRAGSRVALQSQQLGALQTQQLCDVEFYAVILNFTQGYNDIYADLY